MLVEFDTPPDRLLSAWDRDTSSGVSDGKLHRRAYLRRMKGLCADPHGVVGGADLQLWDARIRDTALEVFDAIMDPIEKAVNMKRETEASEIDREGAKRKGRCRPLA